MKIKMVKVKIKIIIKQYLHQHHLMKIGKLDKLLIYNKNLNSKKNIHI